MAVGVQEWGQLALEAGREGPVPFGTGFRFVLAPYGLCVTA
jgi:hypothetical protein